MDDETENQTVGTFTVRVTAVGLAFRLAVPVAILIVGLIGLFKKP